MMAFGVKEVGMTRSFYFWLIIITLAMVWGNMSVWITKRNIILSVAYVVYTILILSMWVLFALNYVLH